jgi:hypothetical protein
MFLLGDAKLWACPMEAHAKTTVGHVSMGCTMWNVGLGLIPNNVGHSPTQKCVELNTGFVKGAKVFTQK